MTSMIMGRIKRMCVMTGYALAGLMLTGCVPPGKLDKTLVTQYQQTLQKEGVQPRAGSEGLDLLRPMPSPEDPKFTFVKDPVTGRDAVLLSLDDAIRMTVRNSLDIRIVGYDAAISREQITQAAAAFDWTVFGSYNRQITDERTTQPLTTPGHQTVDAIEMGVKETNPLGGQSQVKWDMTRTDERFLGLTNRPLNPSWQSLTSFQITQPLLRGFGPDFNLAQLHLARIGSKIAYAQFRQKAEEIIDTVDAAYWQLVQARGELVILRATLKEAEDTLAKVEKRTELDAARNLEYKQTLAAVKTRQANVVRAVKNVGDAEDALARLLSDSRLNAIRTYAIKPDIEDPPINQITIDRSAQLISAVRYNPLLEQARYAIQNADINITVAKSGTLPGLNLNASIAPNGLDRYLGDAIEMQYDGNFVDWSIGVAWEYPIGNRAPEALLRQRKLERQKAVTDMQNVADQLAVSVDQTIRQVYTTVEEYTAQREAIQAYTENLAALEAALEVGKQSYLLVLQLKLQAQDNRAAARGAALTAQVNYRQALSQLARVTGTTLQQHNIQLAVEAATDVALPSQKTAQSRPKQK